MNSKIIGKHTLPGIPGKRVLQETGEACPTRKMQSGSGAFIPYSYVDDENLRVQLYGRIASLATETEVQQLRKEFADRFGKLPPAVRNLFEIARIRIAAAYADVKTVRVNEERIMLIRNGEPIMVKGRYPRLTTDTTPRRLKEILELVKQSKP